MTARPKEDLRITKPIFDAAARPSVHQHHEWDFLKRPETAVQVYVNALRMSVINNLHLILLKEITGNKYLPVWVDPQKTIDILKQLEDTPTGHPLPSDVMVNLLIAGDLDLEYVIIDALENELFQASLVGYRRSMDFEIAAHPSDAISLARQLGAPIYVDNIVMDAASVLLEKNSDDQLIVTADEKIENSQELLSPKTSQQARLRQLIAAAFNLDELRALCFDLGIDYDDLPGESKLRKIIELISYFMRQNTLVQFLQYLALARPNVIWT